MFVAYRIVVHVTPVMKERCVYVKEVSHVLVLMDVIQMISGFVVRLLGLNILAIAAPLFTISCRHLPLT